MYCSFRDIVNEIGEYRLIDYSNAGNRDADTVNEAFVNDRIDTAGTIIDSYIRGVADLPISDEDDLRILRSLCITLTVTDLVSSDMDQGQPFDAIRARRKEAIGTLERYMRGELRLNSTTTKAAPAHFRSNSRQKAFTQDIIDRMI
ncbi:MAG: phage protein Gp36 family protein [Candidatus Kapaibacterium sp.]